MPDLEAFEALVKQNIKLLSAKDAKTRRKAAEWLGEAGDPTAITALAQTYKNDPDPAVREKAHYALGMFRKLEQELDGPNNDKVVRLLEDVALKGKMGGRPRISTKSLVKLEFGLLISAILVAALSFVLPSFFQSSASSDQTSNINQPSSNTAVGDKDRSTLLTEIRQTWVSLASDASTLQQQFQAAQAGTALDCTAFLNAPAAYPLSNNDRASFSDIADLVDSLNAAQASLSATETAFQQACDSGGSLTSDAAGEQVTALQSMMNMIPEIGQKLAAAESQPSAASAVPETVSTLASEPTIEATTALNMRPHLLALQAIIDDMTAIDGPNNILNQYWTESKGATGTTGCNDQVSASAIPADYVLPAEFQAESNLVLATNLVNTGLEAIRQGRDLFARSCPSPSTFADRGLTFATSATTAFTNAGNIIATLRSGS